MHKIDTVHSWSMPYCLMLWMNAWWLGPQHHWSMNS